jgi:hypothetical protein
VEFIKSRYILHAPRLVLGAHSRAPGFAIALFLLWRHRTNFAGLLKP